MANEFVVKNGLISRGNILSDTSVTASSGFLGNLTGTASWATNAVSASWAPDPTVVVSSASFASSSNFSVSSSWASQSMTAMSASYVAGFNSVITDYYFHSSSANLAPYKELLSSDYPITNSLVYTQSYNTFTASYLSQSYLSPALGKNTLLPSVITANFDTIFQASGTPSVKIWAELYLTGSSGLSLLTTGSNVGVYKSGTGFDGANYRTSLSNLYITSSLRVNTSDRLLTRIKFLPETIANGTLWFRVETVPYSIGGNEPPWQNKVGGVYNVITVDSSWVFRDGDTMTGALTNPYGFVGTASWATNAISASWAPDIEFATSSYASASNFSISSSWASASISASWAPMPAVSNSSSWASSSISASYADKALSASYAPQATVTHVLSASWASASISASHANNSDIAITASWVPNLYPQVEQVSASWASASISASWAPNLYPQTYQASGSWASASISASYSDKALSASFATSASWASFTVTNQTTTASYLSGSLTFTNVTNSYFPFYEGNTLSTKSFWIQETGSLLATVPISASVIGTASFAVSASTALFAISASWASGSSAANSVSSSWASSSLSASYVASAATASYLSGSLSFSNVTNSFFPFYEGNTLSTNSFWIQQTGSLSASVPISASILGSLTGTASWASNAISASWAPGGASSVSASWASASISASYAPLPARATFNDVTASVALNVGPVGDAAGVTLYVSASTRSNTNIFELDDAYGNEIFAIGSSGSLLLSSSLDDPIILKNNRNNESAIFNTNLNSGNTASTDYIATSDLGSTASYQAAYYVDLGINSSGYNYGFVGGANDSYLFCSASNSSSLYIGNLDTNGKVALFAGGYANTGSGLTVGSANITSSLPVFVFSDIQAAGYELNTGSWATQNGSYTETSANDGKIVTVNSGSQVNITISSSLPAAFAATYYQSGSGKVVFVAGASTNLRSRTIFTASAGQYAVVGVTRVSATDFVIMGDVG